MAYAPGCEPVPGLANPAHDAYKRAVGEEKLGKAIVALHSSIIERYPWQRPNRVLRSMFRQQLATLSPLCNVLASLELSSRLVAAAHLLYGARQFMENFPMITIPALDPSRPRLFTDNFARDVLSHVRRTLNKWGQSEDQINSALSYNELFYTAEDQGAFALQGEAPDEQIESQFRDSLGLDDDIDVRSRMFKDNFRAALYLGAIKTLYDDNPLYSDTQAMLRIRSFANANGYRNLFGSRNGESPDDLIHYPERAATLAGIYVRLYNVNYFETMWEDELLGRRTRVGFPFLGDIHYSEESNTHVEYVIDNAWEMDIHTREVFWELAGGLGISRGFRDRFDSLTFSSSSEEGSDNGGYISSGNTTNDGEGNEGWPVRLDHSADYLEYFHPILPFGDW
ncbi:hypothetical protein F4775DRAFT_605138 [Biscogniauxia sp. FL1348]|nr:hypothetical protein F4775DRAFT_605138 [Biscogniauxia sp. FL1348]